MKTLIRLILTTVILSTFNLLHAQTTAFTYQGRLNDGGSAANGSYDLTFTLFATNADGVAIAGPVTNTAAAVTNGLFTATIDFGAGVFTGSNYWLEVAVQTNNGGGFSTLSPRQPITPAPYAIFANSASNLLGTIPVTQFSGIISPANLPDGLGGSNNTNSGDYATVSGGENNSIQTTADHSFIGGGQDNSIQTSSYQSFVGGGSGNSIQTRADHSFIGGGKNNSILSNSFAATIAGGYQNTASGTVATVGGGYGNAANNASVFIGGGWQNTAIGDTAVIGGGAYNTNSGDYATVSGGENNSIQTTANHSFIGGGENNFILSNSVAATIGGGEQNTASGSYATVPGGINNLAGGTNSFAAGNRAKAFNTGAFVWADSQNADFSSTNNDSFNVRAQGGAHFVTGGTGMTIDGLPVLTNGSSLNVSQFSGIISPANLPDGLGGYGNTASGIGATVSGGEFNTAITGTATIGGGYRNTNSGNYATVGGGKNNTASGAVATVGGGDNNTVSGYAATVGGGFTNIASNYYATVGGGENNTASGFDAAVGGGTNNTASGHGATVGGGEVNTASGSYATVPGGINNIAGGANSFAAGNRAKAVNTGAFVWADSQNADFSSTNNDSFNVRAQGGARFVTGGTGMSIDGQPVLTSGNGGTISQSVLGATNSYGPTIGDGKHNFTTSTAQGYYTEIGNMVFVQIWIVWTDIGSAVSGDVVQISLPFSVPPTLQQRAIFSLGYVQGITFSHQLITTASPGWTSLELFDLAPGAAPNYISVSSFASSGEIQLSGFFRRQ